MKLRLLGLVALALCGCGDPEAASGPDVLDSVNSDLSAKTGTFRVTASPWANLTHAAQRMELTFAGTSSQNLTSATSFAPDDPFGDVEFDKRAFSLQMAGGDDANTLLSGLPALLKLVTSSGTFYVRVVAAPAVTKSSGSTVLVAEKDIEPVYAVDPVETVRYRVTVSTSSSASSVSLAGVAAVREGTKWHADLTYAQLDAALGAGAVVTMVSSSGSHTKTLTVGVKVASFDVSTQLPYQVWPQVGCSSAEQACVNAKPADLGACGPYREVLACVMP
jgi:hypothetical protein